MWRYSIVGPLLLTFAVNAEFLFQRQAMKRIGTDPEVYMTATQLITSKGYPCENHWVTTEDGYILNLLRIPHGLKLGHTNNETKHVVYVQHGIFGSAADFLGNLANQSLPFILADAGTDVWLGNSRGNLYSTNHTTLDPKHIQFWDFSWDDMAKYDLPASINYVRKVSGQDKIFYAGHSQGTTIAFAEFSENQELASHIKHFFALAPIAHVWHTESPIALMVPFGNQVNEFLDTFSHGAINIPPKISELLATTVCAKLEIVCEKTLSIIMGPELGNLNKTRMPVYIAHTNAGTSSLNLLQWIQQVSSKKFQKFDYGNASENMKHYGQETPPLYDPSKVNVPMSLYTGSQDWLADPKDVAWLAPQLNVTQHINVESYNHLDLVLAMNAATLIYKHIVKTIFS